MGQHIEDVTVGPSQAEYGLYSCSDRRRSRSCTDVCNILKSRLDVAAAIEAVNGKEAVEKARELNPDLSILDVAAGP